MDARTDSDRLSLPAMADVYRLLSTCFYEPEEWWLEEDLFGQLARALGPGRHGLVRELDAAFRNAGSQALRIDYARLFLGPFAIRAKPYGSVYLDGANVVMGDSTAAAEALYREAGFRIGDAFNEMPDHVAVELEFLYLLTARMAEGTADEERDGRSAALKRAFLDQHLGRWVTPFTEAMERGAETPFYRGLAVLLRDVVRADRALTVPTGTP